jgi:ubiquinone/menaquinone biosynthesis C-methylase UbiE
MFRSLIFRYLEYPARSYEGPIESQMVLVSGKNFDDAYSQAEFDFYRYAHGPLARYFNSDQITSLDVGCGFGRLTSFLPNSTGIDINLDLISEACRSNPNLNFRHYEVLKKYPVNDESIDYVFSYASFIHCENFAEVIWNLSEIRRVLKVGGIANLNFRIVPRGFRQKVLFFFQFNRFVIVILQRGHFLVPWIRRNCNFWGVVVSEKKFRRCLKSFKDLEHISTVRNYPERTIFYTIQKF